MPLHQLAQLLPVLVAHMHEFHPAAIRADAAHDRGEIDFAQTAAYFQFDRIAYAEFSRRLQIRAAQADGFHAGQPRRYALILGAQGGF